MNRKLYSTLCANFNKQKDDEHYQMLKENFLDEDSLYLERAIKKIIQDDKYFPSVARIKEVLNEVWKTPLNEDEKLKRWEKEGIKPSCLDKEPQEIEISDEELDDLQDFFSQFK